MRDVDRRILGEMCRQRRIAKGIKQTQLGIPQSKLARFERGQDDSLTRLGLVLAALSWQMFPTASRLLTQVQAAAQATWNALRPADAPHEDWEEGARRISGDAGLAGYITWHVAVVLRAASELTDE